jgi:hypothetical protein
MKAGVFFNLYEDQAMQIVSVHPFSQLVAKLRCAEINYARACRGEGRPFKKQLILLSN